MPAKNAGKYIDECLSSIRRQTFSFWELIIVNDSSTDDTESRISQHLKLDHRIRSYQNKGVGIIPALQLALSVAQGDFITRMDADDVMPENKLALMHSAMESAGLKSLVTGQVRYMSHQQISEGYLKYEKWLNERVESRDHWDWVYRECVIASPNWLMRKRELEEMGGFDDLSYPEDYDLVLKWYRQGFEVVAIPETTLLWREHPDRTSRNSEHYAQGAFFRLKLKYFIKYELGTAQLVLWGSGVKGKLTAKILEEQNTSFLWMDMNNGSSATNYLPYQQIEELSDFKLLISVYPEGRQMTQLLVYLRNQNLLMGKHYWFL